MADTVSEEKQASVAGAGQGSANASLGGSLGASSSQKKTTEKKTPKKLNQKQQQATPDESPAGEEDNEVDMEAGEGAEAQAQAGAQEDTQMESPPPSPQPQKQVSQSRRRQSRGRGRGRGQSQNQAMESDTESVPRSDASTAGGGRRNRQKQKKQQGGGNPLGGITENVPGGELVGGAGDMVQNTAGQAVGQVTDTVGNAGQAVGGLTKGLTGGGGGEDDDGGSKEQLRLRLELNLDIEIQLKAKIHGDLTLGLLLLIPHNASSILSHTPPHPPPHRPHNPNPLPHPSHNHLRFPLPLIIWHGLGDNYAADGIEAVGELAQRIHPGTFVYNIRLDDDPSVDQRATFFGNLSTQLESVCREVANHPVLGQSEWVDALGFSQGGQFLRGVVERCVGQSYDVKEAEEEEEDDEEEGTREGQRMEQGKVPRVRSLVTFGAQHNGIAEFQACEAGDWICRSAQGLLRANAWSEFVQGRVVPAQYYRTLDDETGEPSEEYLEHSNWLADVNNERAEKNATYAANLAQLHNFVMYVFENDTTVVPKESGWFAEVNRTSDEVTYLKDRPIYKEDWIGLKKLDEKNGLIFKTAPGAHMRLDEDVLEETFREFYGPLEDGEDDGVLDVDLEL